MDLLLFALLLPRDQEISDLQSMLGVLSSKVSVIKSLVLMPVLMQCDIYTHILEPSNIPSMEIGLITSYVHTVTGALTSVNVNKLAKQIQKVNSHTEHRMLYIVS